MTSPRDHHPSELLRPMLTGELSEEKAALVEMHLATCAECRSERRALEMLLADVPEMDDVERARLRRRVAEVVAAPARPEASAPPQRAPRFAPRIAPALGAAATILLLVAAAIWFGSTAGDPDEAATGDAAPAEVDDELGPLDELDAEVAEEDAAAPAAEGVAAEEYRAYVGTVTKGGPEPVFRPDMGDLPAPSFRRLGSSGDLFRRFASAYHSPAATPEGQRTLVEALVGQAPDASIRPQIRACAETVLSDPPGAVLPAYGAVGFFEEHPVLALGFVYATEPGPLDRFMFRVWPRGECDTVLHHEQGRIRP